ncbi:MAG TPA: hypothetical protein VFJ64_00080 [Solirubrobacterales bacterium]|nr:hypothetical protein [Solirubrobacterales bacterium]
MSAIGPESSVEREGQAQRDETSPKAFSFDPDIYGEVRRAGQAAFRRFADGLVDPELLFGDEDGFHLDPSAPDLAIEARSVTSKLPLFTDAPLPLRTLVCLAGNATWGDLELPVSGC